MEPFISSDLSRVRIGDVVSRLTKHLKYERLVELNLGEGSFCERLLPDRAILHDVSSEVVNALLVIKHNPTVLVALLRSFMEKDSKLFLEELEEASFLDPIKSAARYLYLHPKLNGLEEFSLDVSKLVYYSLYLNRNDISINRSNLKDVFSLVEKKDLVIVRGESISLELLTSLLNKRAYFITITDTIPEGEEYFTEAVGDKFLIWNFR